AVEGKAYRPSHGSQDPDDAMAVACGLRIVDHHEIDQLADTVDSHEPRDEHGGRRKVELLGDTFLDGRDPEVTTTVGVKQRCEDAWRIETRSAEPVDHSACGDERGGLQVADQAMVRDWRILPCRGLDVLQGHRLNRHCSTSPTH